VVKVEEEEEEEEEEESALDGLVKTVLSQNTTEVNSQRAFLNLKSAFPTWENVSSLNFLFVFVNLLVPFLFAVLTNLALSFACN
jgi:endonuclease-3